MNELTETEIQSQLETPYAVDPDKRKALWNSPFIRGWFLERGYQLYTWYLNEYGDITRASYPSSTVNGPTENVFPYAYIGGDEMWEPKGGTGRLPALYAYMNNGGDILYAQDTHGRHVAIKMVRSDTHEYRIFRFLSEQKIPTSLDNFNNIIPILELLSFGKFWFVVMPRWGDSPERPFPVTIADNMNLIHSMLKAMDFLHLHKIAHKDIKLANTLTNHFGRSENDHCNPLRAKLRAQGLLAYALIDFDTAVMFPPSSTCEECRLPYQQSWRGTPGFIPPDTAQGEFDFDPFAWDVCGMGLTLCCEFQHLIPVIPMLAPLLDKMMMRDISRRFTAPEALAFFEKEIYLRLTPDQFAIQPLPEPRQKFVFVDDDRWQGLDPTFVENWAAFRQPPLPFSTRVMRFLCRSIWTLHAVAAIRRSFHIAHQKSTALFLSA